jgi:hypothetical protein
MFFQTSTWAPWLIGLQNNGIWGYYRGINLGLWIVVIVLLAVVSLIFIRRADIKDSLPSLVWLNRSFAFFFFFQGLTRISFVIGYFDESYYNLLLALGYVFGVVALLPLVITFERFIVTNTRKVFSILSIILTVIAASFLLYPANSSLSRTIEYACLPFVLAIFVVLYIWMVIHSPGDVRKKAIWTIIGMFIFIGGVLLDSETILYDLVSNNFQVTVIIILAPIVYAIGIIVITMNQRTG